MTVVERIPDGVENSPVLRSITEQPSMMQTLGIRKIILLQAEGLLFPSLRPDIKPAFLFVSSFLSSAAVRSVLEEEMDKHKSEEKPFAGIYVTAPPNFEALIGKFKDESHRRTEVTIFER